MNPIYTIGHASLPCDMFLELLGDSEVTVVADIRSVPYSRAGYNKPDMKALLRKSGICYVPMQELGGRPDSPECYAPDGRVRYSLMSRQPFFQQGIARLEKGMQDHVIALMCAEAKPEECHRANLVGQHLHTKGADVSHIHHDAFVEPHRELQERMIEEADVDMLYRAVVAKRNRTHGPKRK